MFREIRRKNRELTGERIQELLETVEYGFLSLGNSVNGYAYGVPINYVYDKDAASLYFHSAPEGQKLDEIKNNSKVSFCIVGITKPLPEKFSTIYESVIVFGEAAIIDGAEEEKRKALRLLVNKYSKEFKQSGEEYINKSWDKTTVFKIDISHITAKARY